MSVSLDDHELNYTYPIERKEPLYSKLREAKMTKTSTDKKISVIYMRLPKRLASSNDFLNTSNYSSVFLFLSKFELLVHVTEVWGKSANGTVFGTYALQTALLYYELRAKSFLAQLIEDKCPYFLLFFLAFINTDLKLIVNLSKVIMFTYAVLFTLQKCGFCVCGLPLVVHIYLVELNCKKISTHLRESSLICRLVKKIDLLNNANGQNIERLLNSAFVLSCL